MGLLSGLSGLGLGNLEGMSLYETPEKENTEDIEEVEEKAPEKKIPEEGEFLFEKSYKCPVCNKDFKALSLRAGKAKLIGTDIDLRAKYEYVEPLKYDVVMCPICGCASLTRYWSNLTAMQTKNVREQIGKAFKTKNYTGDTYTYEEALERYQMALANSIVKSAKNSEKAFICLKTGWLMRAYAESMDPKAPNYEKDYKEAKDLETEYLKNSLEGFVNARRSENTPICGMDETTLDYLIAALSTKFGQYEQAAKLVSSIITSRTANSRMKDKARLLKEEIQKSIG